MTFIYELDPYCLEMYRMREKELRTSRLSNVSVLQPVRQTDRLTDTIEIIYHAASRVVNKKHQLLIAIYYKCS